MSKINGVFKTRWDLCYDYHLRKTCFFSSMANSSICLFVEAHFCLKVKSQNKLIKNKWDFISYNCNFISHNCDFITKNWDYVSQLWLSFGNWCFISENCKFFSQLQPYLFSNCVLLFHTCYFICHSSDFISYNCNFGSQLWLIFSNCVFISHNCDPIFFFLVIVSLYLKTLFVITATSYLQLQCHISQLWPYFF